MNKPFIGVLAVALVLGLYGCAAKYPRKDFLKLVESRKILETQKQKALLAAEEESVRENSKRTPEEYERLGDNYLAQENHDLAFIQYEKALRLDPKQPRVRYKIARLFLIRRLFNEAETEFREVLKNNPNHALSYEGLGRVCFNKREWNEAEKHFRKALKLDPNLWVAHNFLGMLHDLWEQYDDAIAHYNTAILIKPKLSLLFNNLGVSLFLKGDYEKAVKKFAEALRIENSNRQVYNNLALALCKLGRYQDALEAFKRGGDEPSAHYNLGCIYKAEGKYQHAAAALEKAIESKPGFYAAAHEQLRKTRAAADNSRNH
jgi:Flp pilus assembly protein TadD